MNLELTRVDPLGLPSLPLTWRKAFPKSAPVIYFVLSQSDELLYIGRSVDLNTRWKSHHKLKEFDETVRVAWLEISDGALLAEIEEMLIERFQPCLNGRNILAKTGYQRQKWVGGKKTINFSFQELEALQEICHLTGRSETDILREALRRYVKELKAEVVGN
jgi:hypothetical protein